MTSPLYHLSVTLHLLAAMLWLGGMFFLAVVGAPALRSVEPPGLRSRLFQRIGTRARAAGWISIGVLVATGLVNLHFRGILALDILGDAAFWSEPLGRALGWKLAAVGAMIVLSAFHDFVLGPRAGRVSEASAVRERARYWSSLLARANAGVGILLVYWAVRLARGG